MHYVTTIHVLTSYVVSRCILSHVSCLITNHEHACGEIRFVVHIPLNHCASFEISSMFLVVLQPMENRSFNSL